MHFDTTVFLFLYGLSHHAAVADALGVFFAEYSAYVVAAVLGIAVLWQSEHRARVRVAVIVAAAAALIARLLVKTAIVFAYPRPRPFLVLPDIRPLIATAPWESLQSFPSGHAIFFFALAAALFCFNRKIGLWAFVAAAAISVARVYAGVHWPSDILGGAALGAFVGWLTYRFYRSHEAYIDEKVTQGFKMFRP
ncbi:phosphatase PAP2 family protein [Candidatus Kaiserbacteria bacterium]|nr:phosphatase PAP2 family protein [Candidatus Kaiserbacteria bacterium]